MRPLRIVLPVLTLLAACSGPAPESQAQGQSPLASADLPQPTRVTPQSAAQTRLSFSPVVKKAAPAVVNVYARRLVRQIDPFFQMFGAGVPRERVEQSLGSGVIVRSDGVIVTNNHVVEGGEQFVVVLADRREVPAKVLLADPRTDLAVLKIDVGAEHLPTLALADPSSEQVGDLVLAIGDPFGVGQTVTNGIISALNRAPENGGGEGGSYIQTDAPINPGNSGGALVDMNGDLIGINSWIISKSGTSAGIGFAIPAPLVRRVIETAVGGGHELVRPWLGARFDPVTGDIAKSLGLVRPNGALITDVWPGGPAERAGLRTGDVVVAVGGADVVDPAGVNYQIATHKAGDALAVVVLRHNQRHALNARIETPPATPARDERLIQGRNPLSGAKVINLSPATADALGVDPFARGVLVVGITNQGYAPVAGFQPGDLIRQVNGRTVESTRMLQDLLSVGVGGAWTVTIERGGRTITAQFQ